MRKTYLKLFTYLFFPTFQIHFSELAKKYGTSEKTKVGNMVVNESVIRNDVHLETFKNDPVPLPLPLQRRMIHFQECGFRKALRGDHNTSVLHKCSRKETSRKQIENGEYCLREIIAPKSYQKLTLDSNGTRKKEYFTGSDRKILLVEIRKNLLNDHEKLGLVRDHSEAHYEAITYEELEIRLKEIGEFKDKPDSGMTREELVSSLKHWKRSQHLMIWSDHSSVMNHGNILLTVNTIYDPAFYHTS